MKEDREKEESEGVKRVEEGRDDRRDWERRERVRDMEWKPEFERISAAFLMVSSEMEDERGRSRENVRKRRRKEMEAIEMWIAIDG